MRFSKTLPTLARLNELFRYDPNTGLLYRRARGDWRECASRQNAAHPHVYVDGTNYLLHRLCFAIGHQRHPLMEVDHWDGNSKNNRLANLREATSAQNNRNRRIGSRNKSGVKGVHWAANAKKWAAIITVNRQPTCLGYFATVEQAAEALHAVRPLYHGSFANDGHRPMTISV